MGLWLNLKRALFYPLIARPLRARLGLAACRIAVTGGAPLGPEVFTFFRALGLDIRQVYGQSETAAATTAHATGDAPRRPWAPSSGHGGAHQRGRGDPGAGPPGLSGLLQAGKGHPGELHRGRLLPHGGRGLL